MKREQQIRAAVKQLDGRGRKEVESALDKIEYQTKHIHEAIKVRQGKDFKLILNRILSALRQARKWQEKLPLEFQELFDRENEEGCERLLALAPRVKPRRNGFKQDLAAREAQNLLRHFGYKDSVTRSKSRWCLLAAILYGDPSADLYPYCREIKKETKNELASTDEKGRNRVRK